MESFWESGEITFNEYDSADEMNISICINGDEIGYAILIPHRNMSSLYNEIADTDSYEMAEDVISELNRNKPIIEIADVDVNKNYRNRGVSKKLIEYILEKYKNYQFYLRVCPTDGVDEYTFANMFRCYGFIEIDRNDENGTFMVKK
jgi:N-acetylglutamate synthase-like GNAT family acetyltransferase